MVEVRETQRGSNLGDVAPCTSCAQRSTPRRVSGRPTAGLGATPSPDPVKAALANKQKFITDLGNNYIPVELAEAIAKQVIATEQALYAAFQVLDAAKDKLFGSPEKLGTSGKTYDQIRADYTKAYAQHNTFKFWCMLIPALRSKFKVVKTGVPTGNTIRAPSISTLRAASSNGWVPNDADAAKWVADNGAKGTVDLLRKDGAVVDGLGVTAIPAATAAVAIVAIIAAYYALREIADTIRAAVQASTVKELAAKEAKGEVKPGTTQEYIDKGAKSPSSPFDDIGQILKWAAVGVAVILVGPPLISMLGGKVATTKLRLPRETEDTTRFRRARDVTPPRAALPSPTAGLGAAPERAKTGTKKKKRRAKAKAPATTG